MLVAKMTLPHHRPRRETDTVTVVNPSNGGKGERLQKSLFGCRIRAPGATGRTVSELGLEPRLRFGCYWFATRNWELAPTGHSHWARFPGRVFQLSAARKPGYHFGDCSASSTERFIKLTSRLSKMTCAGPAEECCESAQPMPSQCFEGRWRSARGAPQRPARREYPGIGHHRVRQGSIGHRPLE